LGQLLFIAPTSVALNGLLLSAVIAVARVLKEAPIKVSENYTGSKNLEVMQDAVNYNQFLRDLVANHVVDSSRVLDFGAGIGTFSDSVPVPIDQICCVEPDGDQRDILKSKGYDVFASADELPGGTFTYAFSLNVLEHIEDHGEALKQIHAAMRPGGTIFFYVPAFDHLRTQMDDLVGHCRRYTRGGLIEVVQGAGFKVTQSGYTDFLGYFATLLVKVMEVFKDKPTGELNNSLLILYDRLAFPISKLLSIPFRPVLGKNAFIVATKE
jgi:SAM-dependent methyltransferase